MINPERIPVIAAVGEVIDREDGREPRRLIAEAAEQALATAPRLRGQIDEIDVISIASFRYANIAKLIADDLHIKPSRMAETTVGGEKPIRLLGEIAERIVNGEAQAALLCGGEAMRARAQAAKRGEALDWGPADPAARPSNALDYVTEQAARHGLTSPVNVYPLYENATRHAWHQRFDDAQRESALLGEQFSAVAARNPYAWIVRETTAAQICADTPDNRMIAYPYRKLMVANPMVNQAAAVIVTSLANARAAGIAEASLIFIGSGARADEPSDFLARDRFDRSAAQDAVLGQTIAANGAGSEAIDLWELYSCFPTVPKMARRTLRLESKAVATIAGGLTFFGAPANNYMTHAITAAVRALRTGMGASALLYGQGEFVTKHAAIVLSRAKPAITTIMHDVQAAANARMGPIPRLIPSYKGRAEIESFTVVYDRTGNPVQLPIVVRTEDGARTVALGQIDNAEFAAWLADPASDPIGTAGAVMANRDGTLRFSRG